MRGGALPRLSPRSRGTEQAHEWITVGDRRWCLGCSAFQWRTACDHDWQPWKLSAYACPRDTPYAQRQSATQAERSA